MILAEYGDLGNYVVLITDIQPSDIRDPLLQSPSVASRIPRLL